MRKDCLEETKHSQVRWQNRSSTCKQIKLKQVHPIGIWEEGPKGNRNKWNSEFPHREGASPLLSPSQISCSCQPASARTTNEKFPTAGAIRAREKMPRLWERNQKLDKASWIRQALEREAKSMSQKPEADTKIHLPKKITTSPCHYLGEQHKIVGQVLWKAASSKTKR